MVDTRLHEALEAEDFAQAIKSTLEAGASLRAFDEAGRTALHLCVHRRALGPFKVLLSYEGSVDLGDADGCPVLNVAILHKWAEGARAALAAGADVTAVTSMIGSDRITIKNPRTLDGFRLRYPNVNPLFSALVFKQTPVHLAVKMNILGLLEEILEGRNEIVDCLNANGETAFYTAVVNNNMPAVKTLLMKGSSVSKTHNLLHAAAPHPYILKYILDRTDAIDSLDHNGFVALHKAVVINCSESVNFLLKRFNNPKLKVQSNGMTALHLAALHASNQAAQVILEHDPSTVNVPDDDCNTPLVIAADKGNKELISMLLKKGAVLSTKANKKTTVIELIASRLHDCSNFFELLFDDFIYTDELNNINVDYDFLTDTEGTSQINVIEEFVRCGQSKILLHPLIESMLYLKWRRLLPVFCLIICVYSLFIITFNIFVLQIFYYTDIASFNWDISRNETELWTELLLVWYDDYWLLITLIYSSLFTTIGLELFCFNLKRIRYFGYMESWVKVYVLALGAVFPCAVTMAEPADWLRHAACAALLLGWLQAMFLLARFPYWGNYVLMFGKVAINLLKVLVTAVFLVIAFSFCFMIQFRWKSPFDGPFPAFVKTLVMMSSEFDYEDLFGPKHDNELQDTRTVVRLLFVLFVIFLAIVLMNIMIGAAVSDIEDLNVTGNITRLEKQVELLSILDSLLKSGLLVKFFGKFYSDERYYKKIGIRCGIQVNWFVESDKLRIDFYSNTYLLLLHKAFVDIETRKKEVQERNGVAARGAQKDEVKRNDSYCSDQIKVDRDLLQPQPNIPTNCTHLHDLSLKIEQLTSDIASIKQMTSHMAASMKESSSKIATKKAETLAFH